MRNVVNKCLCISRYWVKGSTASRPTSTLLTKLKLHCLNSVFSNVRSSLPKVLLGKGFLKRCSKSSPFLKRYCRSSPSEEFLEEGVLKICRKFTGKQPCRSAISINLPCNFIEIALRHGFSPVNLRHIFRTPSSKNTSEGLLLQSASTTYT